MSARRQAARTAPADPLLVLVDLRVKGEEQRQQERLQILAARERGYSWRLIGAALGVSAQAVQQRAVRAVSGSA